MYPIPMHCVLPVLAFGSVPQVLDFWRNSTCVYMLKIKNAVPKKISARPILKYTVRTVSTGTRTWFGTNKARTRIIAPINNDTVRTRTVQVVVFITHYDLPYGTKLCSQSL